MSKKGIMTDNYYQKFVGRNASYECPGCHQTNIVYLGSSMTQKNEFEDECYDCSRKNALIVEFDSEGRPTLNLKTD